MEAKHVMPGAAGDCEVRVYSLDLAGRRLHDLVDRVRHANWQRVSRAVARTMQKQERSSNWLQARGGNALRPENPLLMAALLMIVAAQAPSDAAIMSETNEIICSCGDQ